MRCIFNDPEFIGSSEWLADVSAHGHTVSYANDAYGYALTNLYIPTATLWDGDRIPIQPFTEPDPCCEPDPDASEPVACPNCYPG